MAEPTVRTPAGTAPVIPLVMLGIGAYLGWYAIHYWKQGGWPTTPVKSVLQGKGLPSNANKPQTAAAVLAADIQAGGNIPLPPSAFVTSSSGNPTAGGGAGVTGGGSTSAIATDALKYNGQGYVWGGPADKPGDWDCSSFVSYVLGHDLGMALPGGKWGDPGFPPHTHGPTTLNYLLYGTPVNLSQVQSGDLLVSTVHMGIAINNTQMISAQDPQLGTGIAGFLQGFPGGTPHVRRPG